MIVPRLPRLYVHVCAQVPIPWAGVHLGTVRSSGGAYPTSMQLVTIKIVLAAVWVVAVGLAVFSGLAGSVNSASSWAILCGITLFPPIVMMWWWNDPPQTLSQIIQKARR